MPVMQQRGSCHQSYGLWGASAALGEPWPDALTAEDVSAATLDPARLR